MELGFTSPHLSVKRLFFFRCTSVAGTSSFDTVLWTSFDESMGPLSRPNQNRNTTSVSSSILRQHLPKEVGVYAKAQIVQHIDDREEQRDTFVHSVALLKRNALAAPFELAFRKQKELESSSSGQGDLMAIHYRDEEAIYIQAAHDRVTVIFSTVFREETDRIFGKVFLQVRLIHPS
jgi:Arp2/3 complex, 34 kD subunit p34-Arc